MEALSWRGGDQVGLANGIFLIVFYLNSLLVEARKCGKTYKLDTLSPKKKIRITMPPKGPKCIYSIFGDEKCDVELSCKIDIPHVNDDCDEEFVKVTDGSFGFKKFCGETTFTRLRASIGLRDLFMILETQGGASEGKFEGLQCIAKCATEFSASENRLTPNFERKQDIRCVCGLRNKNDRIVGGEDAISNEFPWQAAVVFPNTRSPISGATVINDRYVLTSGHTYAFGTKKNLTAGDIEVVVKAHVLDMTKKKGFDKDAAMGEEGSIKGSGWNLERQTDKDEGTQRFQVIEIITHPLFTKFFDYDYALLRLNKKINFGGSDAPTPVCLPPADTFDSLQNKWKDKKQMLTVSGWGLMAENAGATTRLLQKVDVPYVDFDYCQRYNPNLITRRMLCAGFEEGGKDACAGDSGGPIVYQMPSEQFMQVGITSWGDGCGRAYRPGFYARTSEMMQWIHMHTYEGGAKWCKETVG